MNIIATYKYITLLHFNKLFLVEKYMLLTILNRTIV